MAAITLRYPRHRERQADDQQDADLFGTGTEVTHGREFTVNPRVPSMNAGRQEPRAGL
jgi:hypothetical protein